MKRVNSVVLNRYIHLYKKNPASRIFAPLADLYRQKGDLNKALAISQKGTKQHPQFAPGFVVLAMIWQELNNLEMAIQALETAIDLSPENLLAHQLLGQAWLKLRNPVKTLSAYKMVLFLDPSNTKAQHIIKKLELITATHYDDTGFTFKNLQDIAPYLEPTDRKKPPVIHPLSQAISPKEQQQFEDRLSVIESLVYRKDFQKASAFLLEMTNIYSHRQEWQKSIHALQNKIPQESQKKEPSPSTHIFSQKTTKPPFQKTSGTQLKPVALHSVDTPPPVPPPSPMSPPSPKNTSLFMDIQATSLSKKPLQQAHTTLHQRQILKLRHLLSRLDQLILEKGC